MMVIFVNTKEFSMPDGIWNECWKFYIGNYEVITNVTDRWNKIVAWLSIEFYTNWMQSQSKSFKCMMKFRNAIVDKENHARILYWSPMNLENIAQFFLFIFIVQWNIGRIRISIAFTWDFLSITGSLFPILFLRLFRIAYLPESRNILFSGSLNCQGRLVPKQTLVCICLSRMFYFCCSLLPTLVHIPGDSFQITANDQTTLANGSLYHFLPKINAVCFSDPLTLHSYCLEWELQLFLASIQNIRAVHHHQEKKSFRPPYCVHSVNSDIKKKRKLGKFRIDRTVFLL